MAIPRPKQKDYEISYGLAFKLAGEKLSSVPDLEERCLKSESSCKAANSSCIITLKYLNRTYQVSVPEISFVPQDSDEIVELRDKILILHYLTRAKGTPLSRNLISFQELPEGAAYYPSFLRRAIQPLTVSFGPNPGSLLETSAELGGHEVNYGDVAVTIPAFSRVPVTLVIWKGDDEFQPNANVLFDSTILDYLSVEDVSVVCQTIVLRLAKLLKSRSAGHHALD